MPISLNKIARRENDAILLPIAKIENELQILPLFRGMAKSA
jgi:hypothetical protein